MRDPVRFARGFLRRRLWRAQAAVLRSVAVNRRTAVRSCHASGKTYVAAIAALWWLTRYPDGIVITTAPTWTQVRRVLWGEIHRAIAEAKDTLAYPQASQTELWLGPGRFALGLSTSEGVNFQGFHGRILIILDEAPGVRPDIWEAIEGIRAGGDVHVLALGNPTMASGPFYDAFAKDRSGWATFGISAFDTPNLAGLTLETLLQLPDAELDRNALPFLVGRRWVKEKYFEWGPTNPAWFSRVLGEFPPQSEDALLSLMWLEIAQVLDRESDQEDPVLPKSEDRTVGGLDVAGPGDNETVLYLRRGRRITGLYVWPGADPRGEVLAVLREVPDLEAVNVDVIGIGYYFAQHLRDAGVPVSDVNVGLPANEPERYANRRAELYWGLRQRFEAGDVVGLVDEVTFGQLASLRYQHNARGQTLIEAKEAMRKRGVRSPDRADALMLAFAEPETVGVMWL